MHFTLMPFLYQTRTILRMPPHGTAIVRSLHGMSRRPRESDSIPFDYEVGLPDANAPNEPPATPGTITPSERQIFERIFADIEARGLQPTTNVGRPKSQASRSAMLIMQQAAHDAGQGRPATVTSPAMVAGAARDRAKALLRYPPPLRSAASKALATIISQATKEVRHTHAAESSAASRTDDFVDDDWKAPPQSFARTVEVEAKRYPERTRIEGLISSAKSDFELWDILEKEVFTMPARLRIVKRTTQSGSAKSQSKVKRTSRRRTTNSTDEDTNDIDLSLRGAESSPISTEPSLSDTEPTLINTEPSLSDTEPSLSNAEPSLSDAEPTPIDTEPTPINTEPSLSDAEPTPIDTEPSLSDTEPIREASEAENSSTTTDDVSNPDDSGDLSLYIHGPLYPAYLLLALRRLDTAFKSSSPLVFSMLPRIKELGMESYVLGVSTPFFNELLEIYWTRYGNLAGMLDLLEEMKHCGLYFDKRTAAILGRAQTGLHQLAGPTASSAFGAGLMRMPEYERSQRERIRHWHKVVDISAQEKLEDLDFVETVETRR
ncbi:hypothetical protein F4861DRAFT_105137 [Xylaria intraflava]|nr:hypothetical protein F4861DRAFT_105137 [Xylaria intraflava]